MKHAEKHKKNPYLPSFEPPVVIERNNHSAFKCPDCGMVFTVRRAYDNHAQRHVNLRNGTYKCDICEKVGICLWSYNIKSNKYLPLRCADQKTICTIICGATELAK